MCRTVTHIYYRCSHSTREVIECRPAKSSYFDTSPSPSPGGLGFLSCFGRRKKDKKAKGKSAMRPNSGCNMGMREMTQHHRDEACSRCDPSSAPATDGKKNKMKHAKHDRFDKPDLMGKYLESGPQVSRPAAIATTGAVRTQRPLIVEQPLRGSIAGSVHDNTPAQVASCNGTRRGNRFPVNPTNRQQSTYPSHPSSPLSLRRTKKHGGMYSQGLSQLPGPMSGEEPFSKYQAYNPQNGFAANAASYRNPMMMVEEDYDNVANANSCASRTKSIPKSKAKSSSSSRRPMEAPTPLPATPPRTYEPGRSSRIAPATTIKRKQKALKLKDSIFNPRTAASLMELPGSYSSGSGHAMPSVEEEERSRFQPTQLEIPHFEHDRRGAFVTDLRGQTIYTGPPSPVGGREGHEWETYQQGVREAAEWGREKGLYDGHGFH